MSKTNIAIPFDEEKLSVLEFALKKEITTTQEKIEKALEALYERVVPEPLREYVESRITPAAKPKRPAKSAAPKVETADSTPVADNNKEDDCNGTIA